MGNALRVMAVGALAAFCVGCSQPALYPEPPRINTEPVESGQKTVMTVPVSVPLAGLRAELEKETPQTLWSIDEPKKDCVPAQRIKAFGRKVKVSPDIPCRVVGKVTRGPIRLTGQGRDIVIEFPVKARIAAKDVGGVLKQETADGAANLTLRARVSLTRDWQPKAKIDISYRWSRAPGIDFLGKRIEFAEKADQRLARIVAQMERDLERSIAKVNLKRPVAALWSDGFTVLSLNGENPPVWLRITPEELGVASYSVTSKNLVAQVSLKAATEVIITDQPAAAGATPLPPNIVPQGVKGFTMAVPVLADFKTLEPVLMRELQEMSRKDIVIEGLGTLSTQFSDVTIYATDDRRIAVGIKAEVVPVSQRLKINFGKTRGTIWLTGMLDNQPNSQTVRVRDLRVFGNTDRKAADLLVQTMLSDNVRARLEAALTENFASDYDRITTIAKRGVKRIDTGPWTFSADIDRIDHGRIQVTGKGLFLPVEATGSARLSRR